jgi:hypothetical protein
LLQEQDDEWQVAEHRYVSVESMNRIDVELEGVTSTRSYSLRSLSRRVAMVKVNHLMGRDQTERVRRRNYRMVETILAFQKTRKEAREAVGGGCLESARIISPNLERSGRVGHVRSGPGGAWV